MRRAYLRDDDREETVKGKQGVPADVQGTQAPVELDPKITWGKENNNQNEIRTTTKNKKNPENEYSETIHSDMCVGIEIKTFRNKILIQKWW